MWDRVTHKSFSPLCFCGWLLSLKPLNTLVASLSNFWTRFSFFLFRSNPELNLHIMTVLLFGLSFLWPIVITEHIIIIIYLTLNISLQLDIIHYLLAVRDLCLSFIGWILSFQNIHVEVLGPSTSQSDLIRKRVDVII